MNKPEPQNNSVEIFDPNAALKPITVTPAAAVYIEKQIKERGKGIGLRLSIKKAGCSGLEYAVDFVDAKEAHDHVYPINANLVVLVKDIDLLYVHGTEIDFEKRGIVGGVLVFKNPNAKVSCGCGESFNV